MSISSLKAKSPRKISHSDLPSHSPAISWKKTKSRYSEAAFREEGSNMLARLVRCPNLELGRINLQNYIMMCEAYVSQKDIHGSARFPVRDCAHALKNITSHNADKQTGFSVTQALLDLANDVKRDDLTPAFFAEMIHLVQGVEGRSPNRVFGDFRLDPTLRGRAAALKRSSNMDLIWNMVQEKMNLYPHGLQDGVIAKREERRRKIMAVFGIGPEEWSDWKWQVGNVVSDEKQLESLVPISKETREAIRKARANRLPFGVTPFYLSLMDEKGEDDRALRMQVFPSLHYVDGMISHKGERGCSLDFMREGDTSPVPLITRRYPSILILKPFNTCPQICVYCQRNWEIDEAMAPDALASEEAISRAIRWIREHPAITEVLVTGGDPLVMEDTKLKDILDRLADIPHIERIRIGTRTPVTLPTRITPELAHLLAGYRRPGRREISVMTHVQHPYEINPDMVAAIERLRQRGIGVYNQLVYTFYISRRFEAAVLRKLLRLIGIDPYYTFNTKGKEETDDYRVPIARLLQEQKEETRLMPGLVRTDEAVFNVPMLGKSYLRAAQHRDLLTVLPDGSRVYEFHPWEKNIANQKFYRHTDVPIITYLDRLAGSGEDPADYESIWYYF